MTIDYKALAERLSSLADEFAAFGHHTSEQKVDDLRTVVSLLDGMVEVAPIYAYEWNTYGGGVHRSFSPAPYNGREPTRALMLYLHPAPQPQPERQPVSEPTESDAEYWTKNRAAILDAIERAGFMLMSTASGFWLHRKGKAEAFNEKSEPTEVQIDIRWLRNVANAGRGATMTDALHQAVDEIERLRAALAARDSR